MLVLLLHLSLSYRYMLNWVKIRVWEQVQWDGVIMIDVDVTVLGDLTHIFKLPTDFAAVPDNGKVWNRYIGTLRISTSMKQTKGPLHMHCKLSLHACIELLLLLQLSLDVCTIFAFPFWGSIDQKGKGGLGGGGGCVCVSGLVRPCVSFVCALYNVRLLCMTCGFQSG